MNIKETMKKPLSASADWIVFSFAIINFLAMTLISDLQILNAIIATPIAIYVIHALVNRQTKTSQRIRLFTTITLSLWIIGISVLIEWHKYR